jgi:hypothetical protein
MALRLDVASLRDRRAITVPLARQLVSELGVHSSSSARDSGVT